MASGGRGVEHSREDVPQASRPEPNTLRYSCLLRTSLPPGRVTARFLPDHLVSSALSALGEPLSPHSPGGAEGGSCGRRDPGDLRMRPGPAPPLPRSRSVPADPPQPDTSVPARATARHHFGLTLYHGLYRWPENFRPFSLPKILWYDQHRVQLSTQFKFRKDGTLMTNGEGEPSGQHPRKSLPVPPPAARLPVL